MGEKKTLYCPSCWGVLSSRWTKTNLGTPWLEHVCGCGTIWPGHYNLPTEKRDPVTYEIPEYKPVEPMASLKRESKKAERRVIEWAVPFWSYRRELEED